MVGQFYVGFAGPLHILEGDDTLGDSHADGHFFLGVIDGDHNCFGDGARTQRVFCQLCLQRLGKGFNFIGFYMLQWSTETTTFVQFE